MISENFHEYYENLDEYVNIAASIISKRYIGYTASSVTLNLLSDLENNYKKDIIVYLKNPITLFSIKGIPFITYGLEHQNRPNNVYVLEAVSGDSVVTCDYSLRHRHKPANLMRFLIKNVDILNHTQHPYLSGLEKIAIPYSKMNELKF